MLHTHEVTGSSPVVRTKNPMKSQDFIGFLLFLQLFWCIKIRGFVLTHTVTHTRKCTESGKEKRAGYPARILDFSHRSVDDSPDGIGSVLLHLRRGVRVGVQGEACRVVAKRAGERFHIYAVFQGERGEGVA